LNRCRLSDLVHRLFAEIRVGGITPIGVDRFMKPTTGHPVSRLSHSLRLGIGIGLLASSLGLLGCAPGDGPAVGGAGEGPGRRQQALALTPEEELKLGRQAFREILAKSRVLPKNTDEVRRVTRVGRRIAQAAEIQPLEREINLHFDPDYIEWEFAVVVEPHVNAFCLPGGKVVVYTGLLSVVQESDDFLATVLSHEIAHALAHHASERVAAHQMTQPARDSSNGDMGSMEVGEKSRLIDVLAGIGSELHGLSAARRQESEADHIGLFLMTFAGYNPEKAVVFWERMQEISQQRGTPLEILSDHPSDARRIAQIRAWAPQAEGAKKAFELGRIAPADRGP
jgi:metalloendopeptidase OMA1, mitochondrial